MCEGLFTLDRSVCGRHGKFGLVIAGAAPRQFCVYTATVHSCAFNLTYAPLRDASRSQKSSGPDLGLLIIHWPVMCLHMPYTSAVGLLVIHQDMTTLHNRDML